ncbi:MAG: methionine biosynthesis protein MetW [Betaproteobacteria bacterium]|nr:methionine biosynthesis protein MetW [Betaproteobacteria bacterium]
MITRADFEVIAGWIRPGARVLDLGCGDGSLLAYLQLHRDISGYGIENDDANLLACIDNGVNVIQSNLEAGLKEIEDASFDYVILSQTLQAMRRTEKVVAEMLRVGREAIVTFPNFGYWPHRLQIALGGHMPVSKDLPYQWFDTPNIHLCTVRDFEKFCADHAIAVRERLVMSDGTQVRVLPNLFGKLAIFHLASQDAG